MPLSDVVVGDVRSALLTLLGAVGLLLAVACANVAGLLVARTSARTRELAVRAALGAGRGRLTLQFLVESLVLSLSAGALGTLLAIAGVRILPAILPVDLPRKEDIAINDTVASLHSPRRSLWRSAFLVAQAVPSGGAIGRHGCEGRRHHGADRRQG